MRLILCGLLVVLCMGNGQMHGMEQLKKLFNALGFKKRYAAGQAPLERAPHDILGLIINISEPTDRYKDMCVRLQMINSLVCVSKTLKAIMLSESIQKIKTDMLSLIEENNRFDEDGIYGMSLLMHAAQEQDETKVRDLLMHGARPHYLCTAFLPGVAFIRAISTQGETSMTEKQIAIAQQLLEAYPKDKLSKLYDSVDSAEEWCCRDWGTTLYHKIDLMLIQYEWSQLSDEERAIRRKNIRAYLKKNPILLGEETQEQTKRLRKIL